jgi:Putative transposase
MPGLAMAGFLSGQASRWGQGSFDDSRARFEELPRPTPQELQAMVDRLANKTLSMLRRRGLEEAEPVDALGRVRAEAVQVGLSVAWEASDAHHRAGFAEGFSLEAGSHVEASNRAGLEQMLKYMRRPPVANARVRKLADGRVELRLKRPDA